LHGWREHVTPGGPVGEAMVNAARDREPEGAVADLNQIVDVALLGPLRRRTDVDGPEKGPGATAFQPLQAALGPTPDRSVSGFEEPRHRARARILVVRGDDGEHGCASRIEPDEAAGGRNPVLARSRFEQIADVRAGQPLLYPEVRERVAVEARQAVARAEPQK